MLDYGTLEDLCDEGLLDGLCLGEATAQGYAFEIDVDPNSVPPSYLTTARPVFPGVTGNDRFSMDESEVVLVQTDPNAAAGHAQLIEALHENLALAWDDLVAHGLEQALGLAHAIAEDPNSHAVIVRSLDPNQDGFLDEHELLDSDLLALAQASAPDLPPPSPPAGEVITDPALGAIVADYRARLLDALKWGQSNEDPLPPVPIADLAPNPFVLLDLLGALIVPMLGRGWLLIAFGGVLAIGVLRLSRRGRAPIA